jgi:septal ring-binding cell division protein DamX
VSALAERRAAETVCPQCGSPLAPDQEWCLECGAPVRVRIRSAPDWRAPLAIVAGVVVLVAVGFVIALVALSNTANRSVATPAAAAPASTATQPATTAQKTTAQKTSAQQTTALQTTTLATWPTGVTGYTVVLGVIPAKAAATASAIKIAAAGTPAGILYSSDYSSMRPGHWIVFSGTYTTRAQADAAATQLQTKGQSGAYAFPVVPAG